MTIGAISEHPPVPARRMGVWGARGSIRERQRVGTEQPPSSEDARAPLTGVGRTKLSQP